MLLLVMTVKAAVTSLIHATQPAITQRMTAPNAHIIVRRTIFFVRS